MKKKRWFCSLTFLTFYWFLEAGGVVTDAAGNPLDFSNGKYLDLDKGIIVASKKLMPLLLSAVQEALREQSQSASTS